MEWRGLTVWVQGLYSSTGRMEGYSDFYMVSDSGLIKDKSGNLIEEKTSTHMPPYKAVILLDADGNKHERLVHRIVATTFKDSCGEINQVVNHLDENKLNNSKLNLKWCTLRENYSYGNARELSKINLKKSIERKKKEREMEENKPRPILINIHER